MLKTPNQQQIMLKNQILNNGVKWDDVVENMVVD
jgi:hypothetical protein